MKNFTLIMLCLLVAPGLLLAQWKPYDLGTGETSNKLYAFNNQQAILVGNDTIILKTTDGGVSWYAPNFTLPNAVEYHFMDIDFADEQTGFITSTKLDPHNGIMLKSTDAGENWTEIALSNFSDGLGSDVTDPTLGKKVNFRAIRISGDIGYVALQWEEAATTTKHGYIFKTADKGSTWKISSADLGKINVNSIEFIGDVVYVGGSSSAFLKSADGGANWTDYTNSAFLSVNDLRLVDANKIYLATTKGIFYTEDAGVTINALSDIGAFDVLFFAEDNLILSAFTATKTVRSIDAGTSWQASANGQTTSFWDVTLFNDTIYALGNSGIINKLHPSELKDPVINFTHIFKGSEAEFTNTSENCGNFEWIFTADSSSFENDAVYRFADYDPHTIKLVGENAVLKDTISNELTVQKPTASFTNLTEDGNNVFFTNTSKNCATFNWDFGELTGSTEELTTSHVYSSFGTYTVTLTADNYIEKVTATAEITIDSVGAFWSRNQLETSQILQKMHVFNNEVAIAAGNSTTILKTIDGGTTWKEAKYPTDNAGHILNDIIFFDDNTGLITASAKGSVNGFMLTSSDKGDNWTAVPLTAFSDGSGDETKDPAAGSKVYFYYMEQIDATTAFVTVRWVDASSAYHGYIYKTTDKGTNWAKVSDDIYATNSYTSIITDIAFAPSGQVGYVSGNKFLLKTEDSGATWTNISNDAFGYITEMLVLNNDTVLASTGNGVLKTADAFTNHEFVTTDYSFDIISLGEDKYMAGKDANTCSLTEDFGANWVNMGNGLSASFFEITVFNNKIWAFSSKGLTSVSYLDNYNAPVMDFEYSIDELAVTFTNNSKNVTAQSWTFGDDQTSVEVSPVHTYADYGKYTVILSGNNLCKKATVSKEIELVKTTDINVVDASEITMYPNPVTNGKVYINLGDNDGEMNLEIYNTAGAMVKAHKVEGSEIELNMDLNNGLYFVKVYNNQGINHTMKLIIQ